MECKRRHQNAWAFRLKQQRKISTSICFLTLTYENPPLSFNKQPTLHKKDLQNFFKRIRKKIKNSTLKYYACGEYGSITQRPHYHAIVYNLPHSWITDSSKLYDTWNHGHIHLGDTQNGSIEYTLKYMDKGRWEPQHELDDRNPEFSLMSKKLGLNYLTPQIIKYHKSRLESYVTLPGGQKTSMPRYFRDKIFNYDEKQIISAAAEESRHLNFTKLFNDSYKHEDTWKKDQIRKETKQLRLSRQKI
jgi:hypothetical protein